DQGVETTDDPVTRFVLWREARDLAAQAGDTARAFKAVDALAKEYQVNGLEMKAVALEIAGRGTLTPASGELLVDKAMSLAEEAIAADDYDAASKFYKVAETVATKIKDVSQ